MLPVPPPLGGEGVYCTVIHRSLKVTVSFSHNLLHIEVLYIHIYVHIYISLKVIKCNKPLISNEIFYFQNEDQEGLEVFRVKVVLTFPCPKDGKMEVVNTWATV